MSMHGTNTIISSLKLGQLFFILTDFLTSDIHKDGIGRVTRVIHT